MDTSNGTGIGKYFHNPTHSLMPDYRSVVALRDDAGRRVATIPVASGTALFLDALVPAVAEFEQVPAEGEAKNWSAFFDLYLLLSARKLDPTVVPKFTNRDFKILIDECVSVPSSLPQISPFDTY
jgi:hypothetical protein